MKKFLAEFLGTFFLFLIIGVAALLGTAGPLAPVAVGCGLVALVYIGGFISKAHYNPAVTMAFFIRNRLEGWERKQPPRFELEPLGGGDFRLKWLQKVEGQRALPLEV